MKKILILLFAITANIGVSLAAIQNEATVIYSESFSSGQGNFTIDNKQIPSALSYVWKWRSADYGIVASAYISGTSYDSESWLISPSISLSGYSTATLSFEHAVNKGAPTNFKVKISTDNGSTWNDLSISQWPAGTNWTFINATTSLDEYVGENIKVAFCYISTSSLAPQWEIKAFEVKANGTNSSSFVGFSADNRLGEQIYAENLIQDKVNVTLEETETQNHKYNINLVIGGTGSFTMGGVKFLYSHSEAGKTAYKTYNAYIQPNGADREILIPTIAGDSIEIDLLEACEGVLVDGVATDFVAGGNIVVAKSDSIVLRNTNAKPKITSIFPLGRKDYSGLCGNNIKWILSNGMLNISGIGAMLDFGYGVNAPWNKYQKEITQVVINEGVTSIGNYAFENCTDLESITIPISLASIGEGAFNRCTGLTSVVWKAKNCEGYNFGSQVTSFTFGDKVEVIPDGICSGMTNLTSITIPDNVVSIGGNAFYGCIGLTSIEIPNKVTSIGDGAFKKCTGFTSIEIPNSVTIIKDETFSGCTGLTSFAIPNSVTSIGEETFSNCYKLKYVTIGNGVTSIGNKAFENCNSLTSIEIPNSITSIGDKAFSSCDNITSVVWNAKNCNSYNFGSQVTSFTFGDKVEVIPDGICSGMTNLTSITIPNSVINLGGGAFMWCAGLTSVYISNSVTSIEANTFYGCTGLTSIDIPDNVDSIGYGAFFECRNLNSVTIGEGVSYIDYYAFYLCSNVTIVVWKAKNCNKYNFGSQVKSYTFGDKVEVIPDGICSDMSLTSIKIPNSVTSIGSSAFYGCDKLKSVTIGNSVTSIGNDAFHSCYSLTSIDIPNSVTSIGEQAFYNCNRLERVTIGSGVQSIGYEAFKLCPNLWSVTINSAFLMANAKMEFCDDIFDEVGRYIIGEGVTSIAKWFWGSDDYISSLVLPSSLKSIGSSAINFCFNLSSVTCYATIPPSATGNFNALYKVYNCLYVPAESVEAYKAADGWKNFSSILPISAEQTETTDVKTTTTENSVDVIWPSVLNAYTYELVIKDKDGNVICTLVFNSAGQLTSIAFAPSRDEAPQHTQTAGFSFTVTGLEPGTTYDLTITAKNSKGQELDKKNVTFHTNWPNGIEDIHVGSDKPVKVLHEGQIYILRGEKIYTLQGQEVR